MTILVTGTAGFIGYHAATALLQRGEQVVGLDNFNNYYRTDLKRARHERLEAHPGFQGVKMDLCDSSDLMDLFRQIRPTRVLHLAAQAGVRYSLENPGVYQKSNLEGFLNILEACRHNEVQRLVYASSSSVYGGNTKTPFSEADPVDHPVSLYAATKKANELMAHTYTHLFGLQTVGLRFFTVYGPWGRPDMAIWLFTQAILAGRPIAVFNHGNMLRDFTYIDDIVSGALGALFSEGLDPSEVFNLGNNHPERLLDMIALLEKLLGREAIRELLPIQPGDVPSTWADIRRAQEKLGFAPATPLAEGLPRFVDWYREWVPAHTPDA